MNCLLDIQILLFRVCPPLPRVQKSHTYSPNPLSLPKLDNDLPALDKADIEGNDEDIEAVLEEDFSSPYFSTSLPCHHFL